MDEVAGRDHEPWTASEQEMRRHPHILLLPYYDQGEDIYIMGGTFMTFTM